MAMGVDAIDALLREHQTTILRERRAVDRQPFVRPVELVIPRRDLLRAFSRDISRNGISLIVNAEVAPGTNGLLRVHSVFGNPLETQAEARWCDPFGTGWYVTGWYFLSSR
jgi:hypothetical protein